MKTAIFFNSGAKVHFFIDFQSYSKAYFIFQGESKFI